MPSRLAYSTIATIAFTAWASAVRAQAAGAFREVATLGHFESAGWIAATPDGRSVLVAVDTTLLLVNLDSGATSVIARGQFTRIAVSRQATHIAFDRAAQDDTRQIWVARIDLRKGVVDSARILTTERDYSPVFSPDGGSIAFSREYATADSLAVIELQSGRVRMLPAAGDLRAVGWSPDGTAIYFAAGGGPRGNQFAIARLTIADGSVTPVLAGNFLPRARLSLDGLQLLYAPTTEDFGIAGSRGDPMSMISGDLKASGHSASQPDWVGASGAIAMTSMLRPRALIAIEMASGRPLPLSEGLEWVGASAVSHDSRRVAAISAKDGPPRLSVFSISGARVQTFSTRRPVAPSNTGSALPRWSPDDRFVAVPTGTVGRPGSHPVPTGIDVVELATSRVFTLDIDHDVGRFVWSPDSRSIRYVHSQGADSTDPRPMQVREAGLEGGNRLVRELPKSADAVLFQDFNHAYIRLDGTLIDLLSGAIRDVVPPAALPQAAPVAALPCFSPNGAWMAMPTSAARRGPYNRVLLVSLSTGERRILNAGLQRTMPEGVKCHPDSQHLVVTGVDSTGVSRVVLLSIADETRRTITEVDYDLEGAVQFSIAPDGQTLVLSRSRPPLSLKLFLYEAGRQ
jgi:Tol biopolymer transport system component